jgi:hypothetical protein
MRIKRFLIRLILGRRTSRAINWELHERISAYGSCKDKDHSVYLELVELSKYFDDHDYEGG